jgi:hypothetical protein
VNVTVCPVHELSSGDGATATTGVTPEHEDLKDQIGRLGSDSQRQIVASGIASMSVARSVASSATPTVFLPNAELDLEIQSLIHVPEAKTDETGGVITSSVSQSAQTAKLPTTEFPSFSGVDLSSFFKTLARYFRLSGLIRADDHAKKDYLVLMCHGDCWRMVSCCSTVLPGMDVRNALISGAAEICIHSRVCSAAAVGDCLNLAALASPVGPESFCPTLRKL